jgi:hypothetical protein
MTRKSLLLGSQHAYLAHMLGSTCMHRIWADTSAPGDQECMHACIDFSSGRGGLSDLTDSST